MEGRVWGTDKPANYHKCAHLLIRCTHSHVVGCGMQRESVPVIISALKRHNPLKLQATHKIVFIHIVYR